MSGNVKVESEVRIVELEPMRFASFYGFGKEPEGIAWTKMEAWAKPRGMWQKLDEHPVFGFNNPDPSPGSPNYGYEVWLRVGPEVEPEDEMRIVEFNGGLYAVMRCPVPKGNYEVIGRDWKELVAWRENSKYHCGYHQWMEKSVYNDDPAIEFILDLYLPLAK